MEIPLVSKKAVSWRSNPVSSVFYFTSLTKKDLKVQVKWCSLEKFSVTSDLIEGLRTCGIPTQLVVNQSIDLPTIWLGFESVSDNNVPQMDKFHMTMSEIDSFVTSVFGENPSCEVSFRVHVTTLKCSQLGFQLKPGFSSQFFTSKNGADPQYANQVKMISRHVVYQVYEAWKNSAVDHEWKSTVSLTVFLKPHEVDLTALNLANRKILSDELFSDAVLVVENGTEIKCHRNILAAQSPFFETMFQTDMVEGRTGRVTLPGMSEESVRALLQFVYHSETSIPKQSAVVGFELLKAGHKYDIPNLQAKMEGILLGMDGIHFEVEVALRLFLFSNEAGLNQLKTKAMKTLKNKYQLLKELPLYKDLFLKNLETAMELVDFFATAQC